VHRPLLAASAVGLALFAVASVSARPSAPACAASRLGGVFAVVPGSAGAGGISYDLRLRNTSAGACALHGVPRLRLLGKTGNALPTKVRPDVPGALTSSSVTLAPGAYAASTARFSPDIPGPGEPQTKQCEPTAFRLKVWPVGGGTLAIPVSPHTPVCEHGTMTLTRMVAGRHGPRS
jgi:hypothetical protein